ncbi:Uncharacterised protein [uncultured archaeon]|nr:Uncharacterised protein [uncultured archaeon]
MALDQAEPQEPTPPKLLRAGLAARSEVIKQMQSLAEKLEPPRSRTIESASEHHWTMVKGLERSITTFGRAQRYVAALFPKEIESINSGLASVSRLLVELEAEIGQRRKAHEEIWYSRDLAAKTTENLSRIANLKEKMAKDVASLNHMTSSLAEMQAQDRDLAESEKGRLSDELRGMLQQKRSELQKAEEEMADLVAPLKKALARISKQSSSDRIDLRYGQVFEQLFLASAAVQERDITGSLEELRNHLAALGLKDKKKEKTLEHIDQLIRKNLLQSKSSLCRALSEEVQNLSLQLSENSSDAVRLKDEMSEKRKSIKSLEATLDQSRKDLALLSEKAEKEKIELEERLAKLAGGPVIVTVDSSGRQNQ